MALAEPEITKTVRIVFDEDDLEGASKDAWQLLRQRPLAIAFLVSFVVSAVAVSTIFFAVQGVDKQELRDVRVFYTELIGALTLGEHAHFIEARVALKRAQNLVKAGELSRTETRLYERVAQAVDFMLAANVERQRLVSEHNTAWQNLYGTPPQMTRGEATEPEPHRKAARPPVRNDTARAKPTGSARDPNDLFGQGLAALERGDDALGCALLARAKDGHPQALALLADWCGI